MYIKIIKLENGNHIEQYINYFDKENNKIYYCDNDFDAQLYMSLETALEDYNALIKYYTKNKVKIYKIVLEYEF